MLVLRAGTIRAIHICGIYQLRDAPSSVYLFSALRVAAIYPRLMALLIVLRTNIVRAIRFPSISQRLEVP
jgi:hypothetical protein